ncbi:MAG: hypothetical protein ACI9P5_003552, partial [Saprospiraceae bacterium]
MGNASTVFITGTGRSGTNITKAIFAQNSQCATLPFEYRFTVDPGGVIDFLNQYSSSWSPFMADKRLREFEKYLLSLGQRNESEFAASQWLKEVDPRAENITPYAYSGWELEKWFPGYKKHVTALMNQLVDYKYAACWPGSDSLSESNMMYFGSPKTTEELVPLLSSFLDSCFQSFLDKKKGRVFVEDNTWSLLHADDLLKLVPKGKIIHVIRDPRDVVSSLMKQRWTPSDLDQVVNWYKAVMSTWKNQRSKLMDGQFMEIKLEDIISNTEEVIQNVCTFAGLEY